VTANAYTSKATTMVTTGIERPKKSRIPISAGRSLMRMKQEKERETLTTFINLFLLLQIPWKK
jgi:hypothetical protein